MPSITEDEHKQAMDELKARLESEFNQALNVQKINVRLDLFSDELKGLRGDVRDQTNNEKGEMAEILKAIEIGGRERRACEEKVTKKADERHEYYHATFLKRRDMYIAVAILLAGFTGAIWYFNDQASRKAETMNTQSTAAVVAEVVKQLTPLIKAAK